MSSAKKSKPATVSAPAARHSEALPPDLLAVFQASLGDAGQSVLSSELAITDSFLTLVLREASEPQHFSGKEGKELTSAVNQLDRSVADRDASRRAQAINRLQRLAERVNARVQWQQEAREWLALRAKLVQVETQRRKAQDGMISMEDFNRTLGLIVVMLARNVPDKVLVKSLVKDILVIAGKSPLPDEVLEKTF